jgi:membrane protease YdiL (CAAX protease family)
MGSFKSILIIAFIALGTTALAIPIDFIIKVSLKGLLPSETSPDLNLIILRSLEIGIISMALLKFGLPRLRLKAFIQDTSIGTFLVISGWTGTILIDHLLTKWGSAPVFSSLQANLNPTFSFGILAIFIGPLLEELFFRAALHRACSPRGLRENIFLLLISSSLFALLHLNWSHDLLAQAPLFLMWYCCGVLTMALFMFRKSLIPGLILHGGANTILFFL